ncbi:MAG TPA: GerMN domain-containing protein [Patescibacteria group bacterium]|nr:GerMN domain-containing protein [Patescibacteria group bacterium]
MSKKLITLLVVIPLILGGCFFNKVDKQSDNQPAADVEVVYESLNLEGFSFKVKYPKSWNYQEASTGEFGDFANQVVFSPAGEQIKVLVVKLADQDKLLAAYNVESRGQTEVFAHLSEKISGTKADNGQRFEAVLITNDPYLILIETDNPGSASFYEFLGNFSFVKFTEAKNAQVSLKIYFDSASVDDNNCEAAVFKTATVNRPEEDLGLIPAAVNLLIQLSIPEDLAAENFLTAIPINTRLLSFGYEDNRAIVNFNDYLNEGGGSCLMQMRRSQIEKTLMALNEVSELEIKEVEIQVEGESSTALQP